MPIKTNEKDIFGYFDWGKIGLNRELSEKHFAKHFQGWSYDLCLGEEVYITSAEMPIKLTKANPFVTIKPGEFALLITYERLALPYDVMAFISVKFTYKKKGLVNISGFHVDPNYKGKIIFSVYNAGPNDILLKYKDPVFMIFFEKLEERFNKDNEKDDCPYDCKVKEINKDCKKCTKDRDGYDNIPIDMVSQIKGQSVTLAGNYQKIESLENAMKLYGGVALGLIISLFGILITIISNNN